jgi:hypothetical protein
MTLGPDGTTRDTAVPAVCDCRPALRQLPMHWDMALLQWRHDDPDAPRCRIYLSDDEGSPCEADTFSCPICTDLRAHTHTGYHGLPIYTDVPGPYAEVAAELHRIADALNTITADGLAKLKVELKISTKLFKRPDDDAVKVATVDAVALAVLGTPGQMEATNASAAYDWVYHKAEAVCGPIAVRIYELVDDPRELDKRDELERLRAEVAELRQAATAAAAAILTPDAVTGDLMVVSPVHIAQKS